MKVSPATRATYQQKINFLPALGAESESPCSHLSDKCHALFGALTRLDDILPVAQRLQLLDVVKKNLDSVQTEAAES